MSIKCMIIEDEPLAMERIRGYAGRLPWLQVVATFDNSIEALIYFQSQDIDLLFLDINLGELSGIQLLETARPECQVIVITAYDAYALKGFELNVTDYLLKPVSFDRFLQAVERARTNIARDQAAARSATVPASPPPGSALPGSPIAGSPTSDSTIPGSLAPTPPSAQPPLPHIHQSFQAPHESTGKPFLFIKTEYRLDKVQLSDILYIEGMRDYRRIHTRTRKIMTLQTFAELEREIPPALVCRVHKSYMVALAAIDSVEKDRIHIGNTLIPISDTYKAAFLRLIRP